MDEGVRRRLTKSWRPTPGRHHGRFVRRLARVARDRSFRDDHFAPDKHCAEDQAGQVDGPAVAKAETRSRRHHAEPRRSDEHARVGIQRPYEVADNTDAAKPGAGQRRDKTIKTVADLKGKRVPSGWTSQKVVGIINEGLLASAGLSYQDVVRVPVPNVNRSADDFIQGKADTFFFAIGSGKVREAGSKVGGLRALPLDNSPEAVARLQQHIPVAYPLLVKPSPANYGVTKPTYVVAFDLLFVTNRKLSDDVVYKVTKALYGGKKKMFASFKALGAQFQPKLMAKILPAGEYHPGAIKFYTEVGMWPPKIKVGG